MIIGVDIDDTVADFSTVVEKKALEYDATLRNTGVVNKDVWITKGKYDWSRTETDDFESFVFQSIIEELQVIKDSNKYINKLKDKGHKIVFITKRNKQYYKTPYESTKRWLDSNGFYYDKIVINAEDKAPICKCEKIDIFIDDRHSICKNVSNEGIRSIMLVNEYNKKHLIENDVEYAHNWKQLYELINKIDKRINVEVK